MTEAGTRHPAWPGLGFDPAPGDPAAVRRLAEDLGVVARGLRDTRDAYQKLAAPGRSWSGAAADAFGSRSGELPGYVDSSQASLGRAVPVLSGWAATLDTHRARARELEAEAVRIREQYRAAEDAELQAARHPDLALAGQMFDDQASLADANRRIDAAGQALTAARNRLQSLSTALADVQNDAVTLMNRHEQAAHEVARAVDRADDGLPPPDPEWYATNGGSGDLAGTIGDVAGVVSAAAGALALIPLFTPIAGPVALVSGGVALVGHSASMGLKGDWNWATFGSDALGVVPGVKTARAVGHAVSDAAGAARSAAAGQDVVETVRQGLRTAVSPLTVPVRESAKFDYDAPLAFSLIPQATGVASQVPTVSDWMQPANKTDDVQRDSASGLSIAGHAGRLLTSGR